MIKNREKIQEQYTWNTKDIYKNNEEIEKDFYWIEKNLENLKEYSGRVGKSDINLFECLELSNNISNMIYRLYNYAYLKYNEDITVEFSLVLINRIKHLYFKIKNATTFIIPDILKIPEDIFEVYLKSEILHKYSFF